MKSVKVILLSALVGALFTGGLTACGKKSDDGTSFSNGTLNTDGTNVSASETRLAGIPTSMRVEQIKVIEGSNTVNYWQAQQTNQTQVYGSNKNVQFNLNINGIATQFTAKSSYSDGTLGTNPKFAVWHSSGCFDSYCQTVLLNVVVSPFPQNYNYAFATTSSSPFTEYKQVAIKYNVQSSRIISMREFKGPLSAIRQPGQLINEL